MCAGGSFYGQGPLDVSLYAALDLQCLLCQAFYFLVLFACIFLFRFVWEVSFVVGVGGVGVGECQNDSIMVDPKVVVFLLIVVGLVLISPFPSAAVRSVQSSETACASVFDTSFGAFRKNTSRFSDEFANTFA